MKVWKDIISGDEMVSDSYKMSESFEGACLEVKSRLITKKANEDYGIPGMQFYDEESVVLIRI